MIKNHTTGAGSTVSVLLPALTLFLSSHLAHGADEPPTLLLTEDFSTHTVGAKPSLDVVRPSGPNRGTEDSLPISYANSGGPVGALVVGPASQPVGSLADPANPDNQSLRLFDYTGDERFYAGINFAEFGNRDDVRIDFRFQRSVAISRFSDVDGLFVSIGPGAAGMSHHQVANRNFELRLFNDGGFIAQGGSSSSGEFEPWSEISSHEASIIANAHEEESLDYEGPQGSATLAPLSVNVYLDGELVAEAIPMRHDFKLGKLVFLSGSASDAGDIDFIVDDIKIYGLRTTEIEVLPFPEYFQDFSGFTVGQQPDIFTGSRPSSNSGTDAPFPLFGTGVAGFAIVDETSQPVSAIDGQSLRLWDFSGAMSFVQERFLFQPTEERPDMRLDFQFKRSSAFARTDDRERFMFSMGAPADGETLRTNAPKAFEVRIWNDGMIGVGGSGTSSEFRFEDELVDEPGTHDVTVYANSGGTVLVFEALDGETRTLDPFSFTTFVNGVLIDENRGFRNGDANTPLGAWGIQTGAGLADENMDMVFDNIRVSQFIGDDGLEIGQPGVPSEIVFSLLPQGPTWGLTPLPGTEVELSAMVVDAFGNRLPNREVTFSLDSGNGSLADSATVLTGADGRATILYTTAETVETAVIRAVVGEIEETADVANITPGPGGDIVATGGEISTFSDAFGEYRVHTFTAEGPGNFEIISGSGEFEVLIVAGGGGGGGSGNNRWGGGGGGAGGLIQTVLAAEPGSFSLTVGSGGAGAEGHSPTAGRGDNSTFGTLVALGGAPSRGQNHQADGGSGSGGAPASSDTQNPAPGRGLQPGSASGGLGNDGGSGTMAIGNDRAGGGGGGAGGTGQDAGPSTGGNGGPGWISHISGTPVAYAGGGGGGGRDAGGLGGSGSGGDGGADANGSPGAPNTGGGGGGSSMGDPHRGGDGGSGIVIVRYRTDAMPDPDPVSIPVVHVERVPGTNQVRLSWMSNLGTNYLLQQTNDLMDDWDSVGDPVSGTGELLEQLVEIDPTEDRAFFRVLINP